MPEVYKWPHFPYTEGRAVYVGRTPRRMTDGHNYPPGGYGNPFKVKELGREGAVQRYREWLLETDQRWLRQWMRRELRGKDLVCHCTPRACHADVILEVANGESEPDNEMDVHIWTDGSGNRPSGIGGWAATLVNVATGRSRTWYGGVTRDVFAQEKAVTNQQMELWAAIEGLSKLKQVGLDIAVYSDSAYLVNCFREGWIDTWRRKDWRTGRGKKVKNRALWETLASLVAEQTENDGVVLFNHIAGHAGGLYPLNDECDLMANYGAAAAEREQVQVEARRGAREARERRQPKRA